MCSSDLDDENDPYGCIFLSGVGGRERGQADTAGWAGVCAFRLWEPGRAYRGAWRESSNVAAWFGGRAYSVEKAMLGA